MAVEEIEASQFRDGLMAVEEVADFLSVGVVAVWSLLRAGKLASVKLGRSRRIPRAAVILYLESLAAKGVES